MNTSLTCPHCGHADAEARTVCSNCLEELCPPDELRDLTHLFVVLTLASGLVWGGVLFTLVGSEPVEIHPHTNER